MRILTFGGLAGWIACKIMKADAQQGIILHLVVGIVGGLFGGFLLKLLGVDVEGDGLRFLGGAAILLFSVKLFTGRKALH
jgi:uncharacterized membrane protein YeaQ/YmgE (transglycosylase-associated protein family)